MPMVRRISTIIATRDRPRLLAEALDSIAAQRLQPMEVIVVDDGSAADTSRTVRIWRRSRPHDFRLRYLFQPNSGPAVARNRGITESRGECVHFMDDDDLMEPDTLLHLAQSLSDLRRPAVSMASHARLDCRGGSLVADEPVVAPLVQRPSQRLDAMIAGDWFVPIHGYLFTREALSRVGPWDSTLDSQEDDEFLLRAAVRGVDFVSAPAALVWYRQHDGVRRATPGKPGESREEGLRRRLVDDLAIRDRAARLLQAQGRLEHHRDAFALWYLRLVVRYGALLNELDDDSWPVLRWLERDRNASTRRAAVSAAAVRGKAASAGWSRSLP